jgi:hypothetical protein
MSANQRLSMLDKLKQADSDENRLIGKSNKEVKKIDEKQPIIKILPSDDSIVESSEGLEQSKIASEGEVERVGLRMPDAKNKAEYKNKFIIPLKSDKGQKTYNVIRIRTNEHNSLKKVKFKNKITFHDLIEKMLQTIPKSLINADLLKYVKDEPLGFTTLKIYESDHELLRELTFKTNLSQFELVAIYYAMSEFK